MLEIFLLVAMVLLIGACAMCRIHRTHKLPPGPPGLCCFGNTFQIDSDRTPHQLTELSATYGPIVRLNILGTPVISLSSSRAVKRAFGDAPHEDHLNDRSSNSTKDIFYNRKHMGCANNTAETMNLRNIHKIDIQTYLDGQERFENIVRTETQKLISKLLHTGCEDFSPTPALRHFYMNICAILLTGESIPESHPDHSLLWDFVEALFKQLDPGIDGMLNMLPILKHLPGKYGRAYQNTLRSRDGVIKKFFEHHKETYQYGTIRGLIDVCLKKRHEAVSRDESFWLTDDYIKGLILDTLAAGLTELTKTIRAFFLLMCLHPEVQSRMRREVDAVIGRDRFPSTSQMSKMPYTEAVILEILRYSSQTPLAIPHKANKDIILDSYLIQKGSVVLPNLWGIHHDTEIWGDPWEFRPHRFLDDHGKLLPKDHKYMQNVLPFSYGGRSCPGKKFAMSRTFLCMTSLLQHLLILPAEKTLMPSADPRKYSTQYPLYEPDFVCRVIGRMPT